MEHNVDRNNPISPFKNVLQLFDKDVNINSSQRFSLIINIVKNDLNKNYYCYDLIKKF